MASSIRRTLCAALEYSAFFSPRSSRDHPALVSEMRNYFRPLMIAAAVSATACTSSDGKTDITGPTYHWGQLVVDVKVNGDPASSTRDFDLFVDDEYADSVRLNGRRSFTLQAGQHRISLAPREDFLGWAFPSWCFVSDGNPNIVHIGKDSTSTLVLGVDCPSLDGSARIRIHGAATGPNAPTEVNYRVELVYAWQQDSSLISMRIPVGGVQERSGVPGIYLIVPIDQSGKCDSWFEDFLGVIYVPRPSGYVLVRDGQVIDVNNALNCP